MVSPLANQKPVRRKRMAGRRDRGTFPRWAFVGVLALILAGGGLVIGLLPELPTSEPEAEAAPVYDHPDTHHASEPTRRFHVFEHTLAAGETIHDALASAGLDAVQIAGAIAAAAEYHDLSRVRPGFELAVWSERDAVRSLQFRLSPARTLLVRPHESSWTGEVREIPYETRQVTFQGRVESSLWVSATEAGMDPYLIAELADIFGWQIDFSREVYSGDHYRLAVEQRLLAGKPAGWGRVFSAEYVNNGETHTAVWFAADGEHGSYYEPDGESLRRMFLKSPVRFSRISSRFSRNRYHPVLKVRRPHYGVDYAAAPGTPIRAVGDGTVIFAGRNRGSGNFVKIRHNSTYETSYSHLRGYGKGIHKGVKVKQGQVIGYVGSTGLATGPHLHFAFYENGRYIDPLSKKFPSADPVPKRHMKAFESVADDALALLPEWSAEPSDDPTEIAEVRVK